MGPAELRVGIVRNRDPEGAARLDAFCRALARATGADVSGTTLEHYDDVVERISAGAVGLAWLPPIQALRAMARGVVVPVALPVRNGVWSYWSALFTRTNSSIRGIDQLRQARAAWVDNQSASGYLVIRAFLHAQAVDLSRAFSTNLYLGSHAAVVRAVLEGEADVGATYAYMKSNRKGVHAAGWGTARVHVIAHAGPIPSDIVVASSSLPTSLIDVVHQAFVGAEDTELNRSATAVLRAERFVAPAPDHLDPMASLLARLDEDRMSVSLPGIAAPARSSPFSVSAPEKASAESDLEWDIE